jgi:hypothetical protein
MNAKAFAIAILCFTAPFGATAQETCNLAPDNPENCARFVGCFNEGETVISGTSRGWETGTLYGETPEGLTCSGTWEFDGFVEKGEGKITCSDGDSVDINFFTRGDTTQAITGVAITEQGKRLRLWASPDLPAFFKEQFPDAAHSGYQCGDAWMPMPKIFPEAPAAVPAD